MCHASVKPFRLINAADLYNKVWFCLQSTTIFLRIYFYWNSTARNTQNHWYPTKNKTLPSQNVILALIEEQAYLWIIIIVFCAKYAYKWPALLTIISQNVSEAYFIHYSHQTQTLWFNWESIRSYGIHWTIECM